MQIQPTNEKWYHWILLILAATPLAAAMVLFPAVLSPRIDTKEELGGLLFADLCFGCLVGIGVFLARLALRPATKAGWKRSALIALVFGLAAWITVSAGLMLFHWHAASQFMRHE